MIIQHEKFTDLYIKDPSIFDVFRQCTTLTDVTKNIKNVAKSYAKFGYINIDDITKFEGESRGYDRFKGDLFEIFAEIFFKIEGSSPTIDIHNYEPVFSSEDLGVDSMCECCGEKATIQVKFRSNPLVELKSKDLGQFVYISQAKYSIPLESKRGFIIFTNCSGLHWFTENKLFGDISLNVFNYNRISSHIDNNNSFWKNVNDIIKNSIKHHF